MKRPTSIAEEASSLRCGIEKCPGIVWPVSMSRLERFLDHEMYQCAACGAQWKTVPESERSRADALADI